MLSAEEILRETKVVVSPDTFNLVALDRKDFARLLENAELSPRMTSPFLILMDAYEVTMMLDETDFGTMRHALRDARIERGFRMLSFDTALDFELVGFIAIVARILAEADVPIIPLSGYSRDHVLIKQGDLSRALKAMSGHVAELC